MVATKKPMPTETMEQTIFVSWFRTTFKGVVIFAIPNGGFRSKVTAVRLKNEGVLPGVPDLYIPEWHLWIEFKRQKGGHLSGVQQDMLQYLTDKCGDSSFVAFGAEDGKSKLCGFMLKNNISIQGAQFDGDNNIQ